MVASSNKYDKVSQPSVRARRASSLVSSPIYWADGRSLSVALIGLMRCADMSDQEAAGGGGLGTGTWHWDLARRLGTGTWHGDLARGLGTRSLARETWHLQTFAILHEPRLICTRLQTFLFLIVYQYRPA
jgi:hypothetical protein